jgi:hypothetical protein
MARGKTKRRRSRKKYFSIYDGLVAYGNLSILTEGSLGTSPIGWFTGTENLSSSRKLTMEGYQTFVTGDSVISMKDMLSEPGLAFDKIQSNIMENWTGMLVNSIVFNVGANVLKKTMRTPIRKSNTMIRKLGMGVQI